MNLREQNAKTVLEKDGWTVLRNGAPDFIAVRGSEVKGVEVKKPGEGLSDAQKKYAAALSGAGVPCEVMEVSDPARPHSQRATTTGAGVTIGRRPPHQMYVPNSVAEDGFVGEAHLFACSTVFAVAKPGTSLDLVERGLELLLEKVRLRKGDS